MKKIILLFALSVLSLLAQAQTMNVVTGNITWQFPFGQTGEMTFADGQTLTVNGKTFDIDDIAQIYMDQTAVEDNTVKVSYSGSSATVLVAGNVARFVEACVDGAHVFLQQSDALDDTVGEITYTLSGTSQDGELYLSGSYKTMLELDGLVLTNSSGAALNIQNGKRVRINVKDGTENTLTDCAGGDQKACLVVKGHLQLCGQGTLNVYGKTNHAIKTGEYLSLRNCTLNVLQAVGDGIHSNEYYRQESGSVTISGTGDDGIQVELDGTTSTGETADHEDEDSGNVYLEGGTINVSVTAAAAKGIKAEGDMRIAGDAVVNVTTSGGGTFDSTEQDAKGCAALKSDGNITICGGTITLKSTGAGGKCLSADGTLTVTDGILSATSTGSQYRYSSSYTASAKAIKAGTATGSGSGRNASYTYSGGIVIKGGTVTASASSHEAIESKSTIEISGGAVYASSTDDAINSASTFTVTGGYVMGNSSGNDGLDANGNFNVSGGTVFAISSTSPEVAFDANTEGGYKLTITGGTIIAVGGLESGSTLSQTCYQASSYSKGTWYGLYNSGSLQMAFKIPSNSRMGTPLVVSTSGTTTLKSGISVSGGTDIWSGFGNIGGSASGGSSVSLSSYTGGNGGGGPGGPGGPGGGGRW